MNQSEMKLRYDRPAPELNEFCEDALFTTNSWEQYSLPIGNGYFGANIFGRTVTERIQISEPTIGGPWRNSKTTGRTHGGVDNFAELLIDLGHENYTDYELTLSLDDACVYTSYLHNGVTYSRAAFASHADKIIAIRFCADKQASVSFGARLIIPFIRDYLKDVGDGFSKHGDVTVSGNTVIMRGRMEYYGIEFCGMLRVLNKGGRLSSDGRGIRVENADEVTLLFTCDTNYELCERVFSEDDPKKKLEGNTVDESKIRKTLDKACELSFDELFARHLKDYRELYSRVRLRLGPDDNRCIPEIFDLNRRDKRSGYFEALLFQYARYLMISASRDRLPAHLQGIWNAYCDPCWSSGYWHNINVQMNYWFTGAANLSDTFVPYINYAKAYMSTAKKNADNYVKDKYPERFVPNEDNGWMVGTSGSAYHISYFRGGGHTGPGSGALTALMHWDYFDYTRDIGFLKSFGYPALRSMSVFFSKTLVEYDGKFLVKESASPENGLKDGKFYQTVGCAFDQQLIYENFKRTIEAAEILGENDEFIKELKYMLPKLDPVLIGDDGQVKEYREETTYSSIGEPWHRHISHLMGLYPGTVINENTPEWVKAAKITLEKRGDFSTGWGTAYRMLLWARTRTPHKCRVMMDIFTRYCLGENLWDIHPPFQIDGNFGYAAAVCEMLMQSHEGYISLLPTLLMNWQNGAFEGLVARGNFVVDCEWQNGKVKSLRITARAGGELKIKLPEELIRENMTLENGIFTRNMSIGEVIEFE